jgi:hypothetical protein
VIFSRILREEEGGGAETSAPSMATASASATERLSQSADVAESPPAAPAKEGKAEAPPDSEVEAKYAIDYSGRQIELTKTVADELIRQQIQAYEQSQRQLQGGGQESTPQPVAESTTQQPPRIPGLPDETQVLFDNWLNQHLERAREPLLEKIAELEDKENQRERKDIYKNTLKEANRAFKKHEAFQRLPDKQKDVFRRVAAFMVTSDSNKSWETAAKEVSDMLTSTQNQAKDELVQSKLEQAQQRVEVGGGTAPAPGPDALGRKDLVSGKVKASAMARAMRSLTS